MTAGVVLGVQSVPDGLATGLLAGLNPLAGLYGYMVGTATGALLTSSTFMAVQGTGAMAMVIADVPGLSGANAPRALATLSLLTGAVMLVAGLLRLGAVLRFVSNAVMVGFINAVGVNIVLGQLANLTGYNADGPNRVVRAVNTLIRPDRMNGPTLAIGLATIAIIVLLGRTRLGADGSRDRRHRHVGRCLHRRLGTGGDARRSGHRARLAPVVRVPAAAIGADVDHPGGVTGVRRTRSGRRHLGDVSEPGWQLSRRLAVTSSVKVQPTSHRECCRACPSEGQCRHPR